MPDKTPRVASGVYCPMENVMNDSSRDPIITEDEVRALNFTPEDILEIEKVILSSVHVALPTKARQFFGSYSVV